MTAASTSTELRLPVSDLKPGVHETLHRGGWLLVDRLQRSGQRNPGGVYLVLEGGAVVTTALTMRRARVRP